MADILSVDDYKTLRQIEGTDRDDQLAIAAAAATDAILQYTDRDFTTTEALATKTYNWNGSPILEIDDCTAVSSIKLDGRTLSASTDYTAQPQMGAGQTYYWIELFEYGFDSPLMGFTRNEDVLAREGFPRRRGRRKIPVEVTATFGWPAELPNSVKLAAAWLIDEAAPASAGEQSGHAAEAIADLSYVNQTPEDRSAPATLPPRVMTLLEPFRRLSV